MFRRIHRVALSFPPSDSWQDYLAANAMPVLMERPFRESEKLVILGLTQDANLTDASLARRFSMKESTVSSIRRRLMDSRQIYFANVPSFHKLGCEMFVQLYGSTNPAVPKDVKDVSHLAFLDETPEIFDSVSGEGFIMMSGVFRNFSDYLEALDRYDKHFMGVRTAEKADLRSVFFPLETSKLRNPTTLPPGCTGYSVWTSRNLCPSGPRDIKSRTSSCR